MNTYIHIGNHKAGSSFYQRNVFPYIKNIEYLGFYKSNYLLDEIRYIQTCSNLHFDDLKIKDLMTYLRNCEKDNKSLIVSSEGFTGTLGSFGIGSCSSVEMISKRINNIFKNPKILLFIRSQRSAIYSLYCDDIQFGYSVSFEKWLEEKIKNNSLDYFLYHEQVQFFHKIFGVENVKIFLFENIFKQDGLKFLLDTFNFELKDNHIINFSKSVNQSQKNGVLTLSKFLNRIIKTKLNQGYTDGNYNDLKIYNLWRYKYSKILNNIFKDDSIPNLEIYENFINLCKNNNQKLEKLINFKLPKSYF